MQKISLEPVIKIDNKVWLGGTPDLKHTNTLYDSDTLITDKKGKPLILYIKLTESTLKLARLLFEVDYNVVNRTAGIATYSAVFGYTPRVALRRDFCNVSRLATASPMAHRELCSFGYILMNYYQKHFPDTYQKHLEETSERINDKWRIPSTPFTSGIVNFNSAIKYHYDAGNIKNCASNMVLMTKDVEGGDFIVPAYKIGFKNQDNYMFIFDGQAIMHGVTPIKLKAKHSYRITSVWYTLEQMWHCLTTEEELNRANKIKSDRLIVKAKKMRDKKIQEGV